MGSLLFECLKDKATNDATKNNCIYIDSDKKKYTYSEIYDLTLRRINLYRDNKKYKNPQYLLALNNIRSICSLIALLELGFSPIIINGYQAKSIHEKDGKSTITQILFDFQNNIINDHPTVRFDNNKLREAITQSENSNIVNEPGKGKIGIFSSGSMNPKIVYVDEELLMDKVFESKYVNEERIIYNTAPLSSVSSVFTNVFCPIVSYHTKSLLGDNFNVDDACLATDIYLPRNFLDIFQNSEKKEDNNIKRIFTFGEQNSKAFFNFVRKKINLPKNVFVNVYGTTECGGLVSEIEEKDLKELHVYYYNVDTDTVVYSYDDFHVYKRCGNTIKRLDEIDQKIYPKEICVRFLPCGFINNRVRIAGNKCIGECLVDGYNTGDIITIIDDKFYVIGRRKDIDKNHFVANRDSEISAITNRVCTTFTDKHNNVCLAVRCSLEDSENENVDHTTYFRQLAKDAKKINRIVREKYHMIEKIIYLTSDVFKYVGGIKKANRNSLINYMEYGERISGRLIDFPDTLIRHIQLVFRDYLGYVPNYKFDENYNIIINKNDINLEQIVDVLNDLSIVLILEDNDNYKFIYDDSFLFDKSKGHKYTPEQLECYKEFAKYDLLKEKLATDNEIRTLNISSIEHPHILETLYDIYMFLKIGVDKNGETIIIPFYSAEMDSPFMILGSQATYYQQQYDNNKKKVEEMISNNFKDIQFDDFGIYTPFSIIGTYTPFSYNNDSTIYDVIGDIIYLNENEENTQRGYLHNIIRNAYRYKINDNKYLRKIKYRKQK